MAAATSWAFPNVERLVVAFLGARAELAGTPVSVTLPDGYDGTTPVVTVTRVGGEYSADDGLDRALVRIDAFGPDKASALDLAGVTRAALWSLPEQPPVSGERRRTVRHVEALHRRTNRQRSHQKEGGHAREAPLTVSLRSTDPPHNSKIDTDLR